MHLRDDKNHTRGYLPHVVKPGASYFVTFRLADSLPQTVLAELENELKELAFQRKDGRQVETLLERERRKRIEFHLDRGMGACWLKDERIAEVVCAVLRFFDAERYELGEWVVMPNHVHVVVRPANGWTLSAVLHSWKLKIARESNGILGTTGERFWQPESFDRVIRDEEEMVKVRRYIRRNPVKAGFCGKEEEWRWGSAWLGWRMKSLERETADAQIGKSALHSSRDTRDKVKTIRS